MKKNTYPKSEKMDNYVYKLIDFNSLKQPVKMKIKLDTFYCVVTPDGKVFIQSARTIKRLAIRDFLQYWQNGNWEAYRKRGFKCLKFKPQIQ